MEALGQVLAWIDKYGLPLVMFLVAILAWGKGWVRSPREVEREAVAGHREREIADEKQRTIDGLIAGAKEHTAALNTVAAAIEERNRIEREMRGRRT